MNTVLSSYNGLTLALVVALAVLLILVHFNGYTLRRRHYIENPTGRIVSHHYRKSAAQAQAQKLTDLNGHAYTVHTR